MKKKIFKYVLLLLFLFFSVNIKIVVAGSSEDDRVFTTTYDKGFVYGNVSKCTTATGTHWFEKIKMVSGHKVCLWNRKESVAAATFKCEDESMERFELNEVKDNNGEKYYGYGCRKVEDLSKIKYTEIYGVVGETISDFTADLTYTIEKGNSVKIETPYIGHTTIVGVSVGESIVKAFDKSNNVATYYKYHVKNPVSSFSEFSKDYVYGNVSKCTTATGTFWFEGIETVSGYKVCLWNKKESVATATFKCEDDSMERFDLGSVSLNGNVHYGYGCRKPKNADVIEYEKKELYVGYGEQLGDWATSSCKILSGNAVQFRKQGNCYVDAIKAGVARIVVTDPKTYSKEYYEYTVYDLPNSIDSLDNNYYYGNVSDCSLRAGAPRNYELGKKVKFNGYTFCASSLPGYNYEKTKVTCENPAFKTFKVAFTTDGKPYKGYGCRISKSEYEANIEPAKIEYGKVTCESLFGIKNDRNDTHQLLSNIFKFMQYLAVILALVLSVVDFVKVIPTQDKDAIRKASTKAVLRLGIAIVIFFVPIILKFILGILGFKDPLCGLI